MRHLLYPYQENARLGDDEEEVDDDDDDDDVDGNHQFPHQENSHIDDDDDEDDYHEAADVMMTVFASITCSGECQDDPMRSPRMN